jgi:hypothetical protein
VAYQADQHVPCYQQAPQWSVEDIIVTSSNPTIEALAQRSLPNPADPCVYYMWIHGPTSGWGLRESGGQIPLYSEPYLGSTAVIQYVPVDLWTLKAEDGRLVTRVSYSMYSLSESAEDVWTRPYADVWLAGDSGGKPMATKTNRNDSWSLAGTSYISEPHVSTWVGDWRYVLRRSIINTNNLNLQKQTITLSDTGSVLGLSTMTSVPVPLSYLPASTFDLVCTGIDADSDGKLWVSLLGSSSLTVYKVNPNTKVDEFHFEVSHPLNSKYFAAVILKTTGGDELRIIRALETSRVESVETKWNRITVGQPPGRGWHAMSYDSDRDVLVMSGGQGGGGAKKDTWELRKEVDGRRVWEQKNNAAPNNMYGHGMCYASAWQRTVAFGVRNSEAAWEWDGSSWAGKASGPSWRYAPAMCYDSMHGVCLVFGGKEHDLTPVNDLWSWDGTNWIEIHYTGAIPPSDYEIPMVYIPTAQTVLWYAGGNTFFVYSTVNRMWAVGATSGDCPSERRSHSMCYDSSKNVVVLFGGKSGTTSLNDTWEFDITTGSWSEVSSTTKPSARFAAAMSYDSADSSVVLYGGAYGSLSDTWIKQDRVTTRHTGSPSYFDNFSLSGVLNRESPIAYTGSAQLSEISIYSSTVAIGGGIADVWNWTWGGISGSFEQRAYVSGMAPANPGGDKHFWIFDLSVSNQSAYANMSISLWDNVPYDTLPDEPLHWLFFTSYPSGLSVRPNPAVITIGSEEQKWVVERDRSGVAKAFLKKANVIITYGGDLSEYWDYRKNTLSFSDHVPTIGSVDGDLANVPFALDVIPVCGINQVHLDGNPALWVYISKRGKLEYQYPDWGYTKSQQSEPILVAEKATNPIIHISNRNRIVVAYQAYEKERPQIKLVGTGDFARDSIFGATGERIPRLITSGEFCYHLAITGELSATLLRYDENDPYVITPVFRYSQDWGSNQLCDFIIDDNDVVHMVWQSNRDGRWEIYYANGYDCFVDQKRLTNYESRSGLPSIDIDYNGNIYVVYQDNRHGLYQILLATQRRTRRMPLQQQNAYLDSRWSGYKHYVNFMPMTVEGPITVTSPVLVVPEALYASKVNTAPNGLKDYIFNIHTAIESGVYNSVNTYEYYCDAGSITQFVALAGDWSGYLYGIVSETGSPPRYTLYKLAEPDASSSIPLPSSPQSVALDPSTERVCDMAMDNAGRIWLSVIRNATASLVCVSTSGEILYDATVFRELDANTNVSICVNSNGEFLAVIRRGDTSILQKSPAPVTLGGVAQFEFSPVRELTHTYQAMTIDASDNIYAAVLSDGYLDQQCICKLANPIYDDSLSGLLAPLSVNASYEHYPVYRLSGLSFKFSGQTTVSNVQSVIWENFLSNPDTGGFDGIGYFESYQSLEGNTWAAEDAVFTKDVVVQSIEWTGMIYSTADTEVEASILDGDFNTLYNFSGNLTVVKAYTNPFPGWGDWTVFVGHLDITPTPLPAGHYYIALRCVKALESGTTSKHYILTTGEGSANGSTAFAFKIGVGTWSIVPDDYFAPPSLELAMRVYGTQDYADYYHVELKFYDNKKLEGEPVVTVNSQSDQEPFMNSDCDMEYGATFTANGLYLQPGQSANICFNPIYIRGSNRYSAYQFKNNQTYFPRLTLFGTTGGTAISMPTVSFSCSLSDESQKTSNEYSCMYSFAVQNNDAIERHYHLMVTFHADVDKKEPLLAFRTSTDDVYGIDNFVINHAPASERYTSDGISIAAGETCLVQLYPQIGSMGLDCGLEYYVDVINELGSDLIVVDAPTTFRCDCSSELIDDHVMSLRDNLWQSSGFGQVDTRITDSTPQSAFTSVFDPIRRVGDAFGGSGHCLRPKVRARRQGRAVVVWEDYRENLPKILGAMIGYLPGSMESSGTMRLFDYDLSAQGKDLDAAVDMNGNLLLTYDTSKWFEGVPVNFANFKVCDILEPASVSEEGVPTTECDYSKLTATTIVRDPLIAEYLIKKVEVLRGLMYYTYINNEKVPVVNNCHVLFGITGTPYILALRLKNEIGEYSPWCPWSPEENDYYIEKYWRLSPEPGLKQICIQLLTYSGLAAEFCQNVIADYSPIEYEVRMYKDEERQIPVNMHDNYSVASLEAISPETNERTIYVNITVAQELNSNEIPFEIVQQGTEVIAGMATRSGGEKVYKGTFLIKKEDKIRYIDGLARIVLHFASDCFSSEYVSGSSSAVFTKDQYNQIVPPAPEAGVVDTYVEEHRNPLGLVGNPLLIRDVGDLPE